MKRGGELKRRTPLRNKSKSTRGTARLTSDFSDTARADLISRSNDWCEVATHGCSGRGAQAHHRLRRSQGGKGTLANGLWVCAPCHTYLHAHPEESYRQGWLIRSSS